MAGISESLSTHHGQIEGQFDKILGAARAADWIAYRARFAALRSAVLDHIAFVEHELFPELARVPGSESEVLVLRSEHDRLRRYFETLSAAAPEHDPAGFRGELEELGAFIREHHSRERQVCSPALDRLASGNGEVAQAARSLVDAAEVKFGAEPSPPALDLRGLQPPEPIVRIFAALERSPGSPLRAILPHEPVPLYALLHERGFRYTGETRPDGGYELLIERA